MRIYFDACSLNRPFDDQRIDRNRLEAEAVGIILRHVHHGTLDMIGSQALTYEIDAMPDTNRKACVKGLLALVTELVEPTPADFIRASEIQNLQLRPMDALHVACAEAARCDVLLTTDDQMLRCIQQQALEFNVRAANPLDWLKEQIDDPNR